MPHTLIVGRSSCGKSRMVREQLLPAWRARGVAAVILDPIRQAWGAAAPWVRQFADPLAFSAFAERCRRCLLILDECGQHVGADWQLSRRLAWTATVSRNYGMKAYFLAQRTLQVPPSMRGQCEEAYVFLQTEEDAEAACEVAGVSAREWVPRIVALPRGTCYRFRPFETPQKIRVF